MIYRGIIVLSKHLAIPLHEGLAAQHLLDASSGPFLHPRWTLHPLIQASLTCTRSH